MSRRDEPVLWRLFDATVRAEYERALTLAKQQIGPLPTAPGGRTTLPLIDGDWRQAPAIKCPAGRRLLPARRGTERQAVCQHLRALSRLPRRPSHLAVLAAQRVDAQAVAAERSRLGHRRGPAPSARRATRRSHRPGPGRMTRQRIRQSSRLPFTRWTVVSACSGRSGSCCRATRLPPRNVCAAGRRRVPMWTWRFPGMCFATRRGLRVKALSWAGPSRWLAGSGRAAVR